jgi:hypothetical protein
MKLKVFFYKLDQVFNEHDRLVTRAIAVGTANRELTIPPNLGPTHPHYTQQLATYIIDVVNDCLLDIRPALMESHYLTEIQLCQYSVALSILSLLYQLNLISNETLSSRMPFEYAQGERPNEYVSTFNQTDLSALFTLDTAESITLSIGFNAGIYYFIKNIVPNTAAGVTEAMNGFAEGLAAFKTMAIYNNRLPNRLSMSVAVLRAHVFDLLIGSKRHELIKALHTALNRLKDLQELEHEMDLSSAESCTQAIDRCCNNWFDGDDRHDLPSLDTHFNSTKELLTDTLKPYRLKPSEYLQLMTTQLSEWVDMNKFQTLRRALEKLSQTCALDNGEKKIKNALQQIKSAFTHCSMSHELWLNEERRYNFRLAHHLFNRLIKKYQQALRNPATPLATNLLAISTLGGDRDATANNPKRHFGGGGGGAPKPL